MNPFLERLGFSPDDRVVIFHADDLGMCHAVNQGFADVIRRGTVRSGAVMVPCPWFPEIAAFAREHASEVDLGVHLTLTSEWVTYRWGPVSTRDPGSGLIDPEGYLWQDVPLLHAHMRLEAAEAEMRAQIERALAAGIDVTHIDTHMGSVLHPGLVPIYIALAQEYHIPAMIPRLSREDMLRMGASPGSVPQMEQLLVSLEESGTLPLVDRVADLYALPQRDRMEEYAQVIRNLPAGLTHLLYHPARPGPEIEGASPNDWPIRVGDWQVFAGETLPVLLKEVGVKVLEYRTLRGLLGGG